VTEPDRDPMIDELARMFAADPAPDSATRFDPTHLHVADLLGIPVREVIAQLNAEYLALLQPQFDQIRAELPEGLVPEHWLIIVRPYLFHGWSRIEGIEVRHDQCAPEWTVLMLRSAAWLTANPDQFLAKRTATTPIPMIERPLSELEIDTFDAMTRYLQNGGA
jgi:hypothetical protein